MRPPLEIHVGDIVQMRKPHPCGGYRWVVTRVGSDIGIRCLTCGRRVMLPRSRFEKGVKKIIGRAVAQDLSCTQEASIET